jgi:hypothetical protein
MRDYDLNTVEAVVNKKFNSNIKLTPPIFSNVYMQLYQFIYKNLLFHARYFIEKNEICLTYEKSNTIVDEFISIKL